MKPICTFLLMLLLSPLLSTAQTKYQIIGVPVIEHGDTLTRNAWVGGLNNPICSPIDLNGDGLMDMFIYDKSAWKALSFINTGSVGHPSFTYAPQYDLMYPHDLIQWAVIRDYNHDGVGDIFALSYKGGITVYKGFRNGNDLSYVKIYDQLWFPYGLDTVHIWTFQDNMPVMMDIDGDGALDVLAPDQDAVTLDYCRNVAADRGYSPDSLNFELVSQCWGQFYENSNDCNVTLNQTMCKKELRLDTTARNLRHQGGGCWGFHYVRNSNVVSLLISDIYCNTIKFLQNTGDTSNAFITYVDPFFPSYDTLNGAPGPINMNLFPLAQGIDMDNDGFQDLMVAPFATNVDVASQSQDINVLHYYHNNAGTDTVNTFHYEGDTLLNNSIVDVGTESHPVFFDYNGDSLLDIVIGRFGQFVSPGNPAASTPGVSISSLFLYKNVGTATSPIFQLVDSDWNHLSMYDSTQLYNGMYPAFGDLDGDGLPDMVLGDFSGNISFFHNAGSSTNASYPSMTEPNWFGINIGQDAAPFIYDVNGDGLNDLIIGTSGRNPSLLGGHIFYYWNFGTPDSPMFSPDSVNKFFGNIVVWDSSGGYIRSGFSNPDIVSENGSLVLYSGSQRGITFKFAINTDSLRSGSFAVLDTDVLGFKPGQRSNVSVADLNHDGKNDYLTGNIRGGLMLFSDTSWGMNSTNGITNISQDNEQLVVFPNPSKDNVMCHLGNGGLQLVSAQLYDMLGSTVSTNISRSDENGIVLNVSNLSEGIYIIQAIDRNGKTYQQKVAVIK